MNKLLFVDAETLGFGAAPKIVALSWILTDTSGNELVNESRLVKPDGWEIDPESFAGKNGYTTENNNHWGRPIREVITEFIVSAVQTDVFVAHNASFDKRAVAGELTAQSFALPDTIPWYCTMKYGKDYCCLPGKTGYKNPKLTELYYHLFFKEMEDAHRADADVKACKDCFFEMVRVGAIVIKPVQSINSEDSF